MIYENVCMKCVASICVNWMNDDMKMRIFYSWLNGNACIKLHFSLLIFDFFENAGIKLYFLFWKWECIDKCTKTLFYFSALTEK